MPWDNGRPPHVSKQVRAAALQRDGNRCTATLRNGTRCPETVHLEIHEPQGYQGHHPTLEQVTTLCHWHHNRITQQQAAAARTRQPTNKTKAPPPRTTHTLTTLPAAPHTASNTLSTTTKRPTPREQQPGAPPLPRPRFLRRGAAIFGGYGSGDFYVAIPKWGSDPEMGVRFVMAGRGPQPKDPSKRARANADPVPIRVLPAVLASQPELPDGFPWPVRTVLWWQMWRDSPLSLSFTATDWSELLDAALLHAKVWGEGDLKWLPELRLRTAKFGATPEDRARLRIQFAQADEADSKRPLARGARDRYGGMTVSQDRPADALEA